jgi:hypothetical protein
VAAKQESNIGQRLYDNGWKTGTFLTEAHVRAIAHTLQRSGQEPHALSAGDFLVVVSQTCDIVASKLDAEPFIEVLLVREKIKLNSTVANLRSTRQLSFRARSHNAIYEAHATNRFWVPRELFDEFKPEATRFLSFPEAQRLSTWLGLRYTRAAWPNEFVRRLPKYTEIEKLLLDIADSIAEIYVAISNRDVDLPATEPYVITLFAVMDADLFHENNESRKKCLIAFGNFLDLLRKSSGIVVSEDSELISGDKFSWQLQRMTDLWNLANLTSAAEEESQ